VVNHEEHEEHEDENYNHKGHEELLMRRVLRGFLPMAYFLPFVVISWFIATLARAVLV